MQPLVRHLVKGIGLVAIFAAISAASALLLAWFSRWFLRRERVGLPPGATFIQAVARSFGELARRKKLAVAAVFVVCLFSRVALIPVLGIPAPLAHDEFSYLLAGDTFAHGRLTNPTPPLWPFFESIHINMRPTYMSMYPPGQGFLLAIGEWLGHPWMGVLLSAALGCALICWMLQAWLPPSWALLGGVIAILQFGILSYWTNTYYCTWIVVIGGALVLGAWPRLRKHPRASSALLLALGVALLALTRPYEGLFFCLPVAIALLAWLFARRGPSLGVALSRGLAPLLISMAALAAFLGYYNWRVSGNALVMPYQINQSTYAGVPLFPWQHEKTQPVYRNAQMRDYYAQWAISGYRHSMARGPAFMAWAKIKTYWRFYFGWFLTLPLLALPWVVRDRRIRFLVVVTAVTALGLELELWSHPHYAAALTGALVAIMVQGLRHLRLWRWQGKAVGRMAVWAVVLGLFAFDAAWISAAAVRVNSSSLYWVGNQDRADLQNRLQHMPGLQLVIVRYSPAHPVFREWVYNRADIEHAKVVWARDMGTACNGELIRHFKDRRVWLVQPDTQPPQLTAYPVAAASLVEGRTPAGCGWSELP